MFVEVLAEAASGMSRVPGIFAIAGSCGSRTSIT